MANTTCKNCEQHFHGNFCPNCSQAAHTERIDLHYFLHDIPHSVFHVDKGFWLTLKELFVNPGKMLRKYLAGKRVLYFKPFGYVIIMSTICTLLSKGMDWLIYKIQVGRHPEFVHNVSHNFFQTYISALIFIMIPLLSLITWLFYLRKPYNYWEHFLANTFIAAQINILLLIIKLYVLVRVYFTTSNVNVNITLFMLLFMSYYGYTFGVLMQPAKNKLLASLNIFCMNFAVATAYITGLSFAGVISPWWNF